MSEIGADEVRARLEAGERVALLDVREPEEFRRGHIPGAVLIPLGQLPRRLGELDPRQEWIVVCRSGRRSAQACRFLEANGFPRVRNMAGGMLRWRGRVAGGPS